MPKMSYYARVFSGMRFKKMKAALDDCRAQSGRSRFVLFFDMLLCTILYGSGYYDYRTLGFYRLSARKRKTILTRLKSKKLVMIANDEHYTHCFDDKCEMARIFSKYIRRGVLDLRDVTPAQLAAFVEGKETVFAKDRFGEGGRGIERLCPTDFESMEAFHRYLTDPEKKFGLLEENICQHPAVAAIYPLAVNCLRLVTLLDDGGTPHLVGASFKFGDNGFFTDNFHGPHGGMCLAVDFEKETLIGPGNTMRLEMLDRHPYSGVVFDGYKIPYLKDALALALEMALVVPQMRYIGWDICITPDGPELVEGNHYPGYNMWQLPTQTSLQGGPLPLIKKCVSKL